MSIQRWVAVGCVAGAIFIVSFCMLSPDNIEGPSSIVNLLPSTAVSLHAVVMGRWRKDALCTAERPQGENASGRALQRYILMPKTLINVDWDVEASGSDSSSSTAPAHEYRGEEECVGACEAHVNCTAFVVDHGRGGLCMLTRGPAQSISVSAAFSSYVRRSAAVEFLYDPHFPLRIAFGMLAAPKYLFTRASTALSTWLCGYSVLLLVEDTAGASDRFLMMVGSLPAACRAGKVAQFRTPTEKTRGGAWKDIPMSRMLLEAFPARDWYGIIDDDTFVVMHNLNIELTTFYGLADARKRPLCVGVEFVLGIDRKMRFPQGGAGILLNAAAAARVAEQEAKCVAECTQRTGDVRLGCCLHLLSVPTHSTETMWSRSPFMALGADGRAEHSAFPTSFHQMRRVEWVTDLHEWAAGLVRDLRQTCAAPSPLSGMTMCKLLALQDEMCPAAAREALGAVLSVPITWDVLSHHLRVEQRHDEELFEAEDRTPERQSET
jgi:hypothetical protein